MPCFASAVSSQNDHGYEAGRYVASNALAAFQSAPPSLLITFVSNQYNDPSEVVRGIRSINNTIPLIGSSTSGVLTMAGLLPKGVVVLALRFDVPQVPVAFARGFASQPATVLAQAIDQLHNTTATTPASDTPQTMLLLTAGLPSGESLNGALQNRLPRLPATCTPIGAISGTAGNPGKDSLFVNDEVIADGVAVTLLPAQALVGSGGEAGAGTAATLLDAAATAGQPFSSEQSDPPAAALMFDSISDETTSVEDATRGIEQVRTSINPIVPLIGMWSAAVIAPASQKQRSQANTLQVATLR
jgi:hypothetical protein